ncbi:methyltransferase domain-containing protein [Flavobacterium arcticum]|uniref:Methyltransferase domain-containing protein n=1 Tax=Flavobacterium arcticum TaxID=1784713 RepID=A0A345H8W1_9FLAO|nr:methyltransferase domain-containing protein [Flavobacterium arcticum]AXG73021.1 methyltransferase domain-containing protein [Flavobacterium arcticum]KAF2510316.1 methyltransferase domain-containing protein [Flavobacterium arcticum]
MATLQRLFSETLHEDNNHRTAELYNEATEDYEFWSRDFNMHFGYYNPSRNNPFMRDTMLNEMNRQVYKRIGDSKLICDLGCGMGGTMKYGLERNKELRVLGVTLSEFQATEGNKRLTGLNGLILKEDYNNTTFSDNTFDSAMAIESFCHAGHSEASFKEAYRILKNGGKMVITDAFLKKEIKNLCPGGSYCYKGLCNGWSLEKLGNIPEVKRTLERIGFKDIIIEDISLRVAPSVLHVPFVISGFLLKKILKNQEIGKQSIQNLKGSFYALLSGIQMNNFGYYIITCTK